MKEKLFKKTDYKKALSNDSHFIPTLTKNNLITIGIGSIIGTGIFILPGIVSSTTTGPAITLSFILAAIVCILAAMCFAELSSTFPVAGSTYSYGSIVFGQFPGWIVGWAMVLEYVLGVSAVSTGFSAYFNSLLAGFGINIPKALSGPFDPAHGVFINLPALLVLLFIYALLRKGVQSSAKMNAFMVIIKLTVIIAFIIIGLFFIKPANYQPYFPMGGIGVVKGAALVFFAYLGFDVIPASAPEVKNPQKNVPAGIMISLAICAGFYLIMSTVLTGMVNYTKLNVSDPVVYALKSVGMSKISFLINIGALSGMFTMMLNTTYGGSRLVYALGRDKLIPQRFGVIDEHSKMPKLSLNSFAGLSIILGSFISLKELTSLVNIGTLTSFVFVSLAVIKLHHMKNTPKSNFHVPFYPIFPILSALFCILLMTQIGLNAWMSFLIWFVLGIVIYFIYGYRKAN